MEYLQWREGVCKFLKYIHVKSLATLGLHCLIYNTHLSPNSWYSPAQPAPPTAFPFSVNNNSTFSGVQTKSLIMAFLPHAMCPIHHEMLLSQPSNHVQNLTMCPRFSTATTTISHLSHCNRFLFASILVPSTPVSIRWSPFPQKARSRYSSAQKPAMSSNLTQIKSQRFYSGLQDPTRSGTNHLWPVPFPPHTAPTTLAL